MYNSLFFFENRTVYEIIWKNIVEPYTPQVILWRMRIECWITKSKNIHSECVTLIAFPLQLSLHERASMFRYKYAGCVVTFFQSVLFLCQGRPHNIPCIYIRTVLVRGRCFASDI